jgi:signal transduction histidine kinase
VTAPLIATGYALAALVSMATLWRCLRARPRPGAGWLTLVVAGVVWWSLFSFGLALVGDPDGPLGTAIGRLEWFGIAAIAVGIVQLGLTMSGRGEPRSPAGAAALLAVPFVWATVSLAHPDVVALTRNLFPAVGSLLASMSPLVPLYVWLNPVILAGVYLGLALGTVLLLETALERPGSGARRYLVLLMVLPPWTLNVLYLTGLTPNAGYDPTVLGFVVTGIAGVAAVDRFRLFETPFARTEIVEELDTPVVAFGIDGRLYDYNERAVAVLGVDEDSLDEPLATVLDESPLRFDRPGADADADGPPPSESSDPPPASGAAADRSAATPTSPGDLHGVEATVPTDAVAGEGPTGDHRVDDTDVVDRVPGVDGPNAGDGGRDGSDRRHFLLATTELGRQAGRRLGYAVQLSDVTEQRRQGDRLREKSRRLERKNRQLERLAGIVAHDLQTPVSTGQQLVELLRMDLDPAATDAEVQQSLEDLDRVLDRLQGFAEHLPRLARESVDVESPVACDLDGLARSAWTVVDTAGLELRVVDSTTLRGDPRRLQQAFENLFANAADHGRRDGTRSGDRRPAPDAPAPGPPGDRGPADPGGATVTPGGQPAREPGAGTEPGSESESGSGSGSRSRYRLGEDRRGSGFDLDPDGGGSNDHGPEGDASDGTVLTEVRVGVLRDGPDGDHRGFFVEDDGPGIPPARRDRIFDFGEGNGKGSGDGDGDGDGYGLAIVRTVVEAHGWTVSVTEADAGGARFEVAFEGGDGPANR